MVNTNKKGQKMRKEEIAKKENPKEAIKYEVKYYDFLRQLQRVPFVGCPCTVFYYSDRRAGQITEVKGKRFKVQAFSYLEKENGECEVLEELDDMELGWFSQRKAACSNGKAYQVGSPAGYGNVSCVLGFKKTYLDPNF